jgi:predicted unusual protein kinase regulating ubiquinone biosynthesis (AarF/ABC1/UbiB family)
MWFFLLLPLVSGFITSPYSLKPKISCSKCSLTSSDIASVSEAIISSRDALSVALQEFSTKIPSDIDIIGTDITISGLMFDTASWLGALTPENYVTGLGLALFSVVVSFGSLLEQSYTQINDEPYPSGTYDPHSAQIYFSSRQNLVIKRSIEIASRFLSFGFGIATDYARGMLTDSKQEMKRAAEATQVLTALGPTFIKVGQSLSIRTDLLRPAYANALATLQDRVPSFPTSIAREVVREELGVQNVEDVFATGMEPDADVVAAASLGQVFKATLTKDGSEVAVKVQRPQILERIALDMHILRQAAPILKKVGGLQTNLTGVVDDWGIGFVDELDYRKEANNAKVFQNSIEKTDLAGVVFSPSPIDEVTTRRILTTEWVVGERLEKAKQSDVTRLCSVAMNTYLTMMLDTGVLHSDPHPGNLLRTSDGRLCILDWGLVTRIDPSLQLTFIEHIAHLTSADYAKVPNDLVKLGFVPEGKQDFIKETGVVDVLSDVYGQWAQGGGAAKVDVNVVFSKLQGLSTTYGNLFQLPPYFAYIARSFGVLEGIGLSYDPDYAILGECLPYISKRLLTDPSERTGGALQTFIYGASKDDKYRVIDTERLDLLIDGFKSYGKAAAGTSSDNEQLDNDLDLSFLTQTSSASGSQLTPENLEVAADTLVELLLTPNDNGKATPLQKIFIEEISQLLIASGRNVWRGARNASGRLPSGRSVLGSLVDPLGIFSSSFLINVDDHDERVLRAAEKLTGLLARSSKSNEVSGFKGLSSLDIQRLSVAVLRRVIARRKEANQFTARLASTLTRQLSLRLSSGELNSLSGDTTIALTNTFNDEDYEDGNMNSSSGESERLAKARAAISELKQDVEV